ncbi:MAG TPA: GNAT family N-acetyltransferase [Actinospica sp.]|jgi:predicted acetyltransferase|nr:GNAT family N-acetyltransferase [Actinospica sp.]
MTALTVRAAAPADPADRVLLERLWLLFRHDMSVYTHALPGPDGTFRSDRLHAALTDPGWAAYVFHLDGHPAGFALVRGLGGPGPTVLNSFFLVNAARRRGHGIPAALDVLRRSPGSWEVAFQDANTAAVAFWPRVAEAAAGEGWHLEHRPVAGRPEIPADAWICFTVPATTV